jgi:hypothetical protein
MSFFAEIASKVVTYFVKIESIEMGPRTPSPASDCVSNPLEPRREQHTLAGEGVGGPNSDDWIEILSLCIVCGTHHLLYCNSSSDCNKNSRLQ